MKTKRKRATFSRAIIYRIAFLSRDVVSDSLKLIITNVSVVQCSVPASWRYSIRVATTVDNIWTNSIKF